MDHSKTNNNECQKPLIQQKLNKISFVSEINTDSKYIEDVKHLMHNNLT